MSLFTIITAANDRFKNMLANATVSISVKIKSVPYSYSGPAAFTVYPGSQQYIGSYPLTITGSTAATPYSVYVNFIFTGTEYLVSCVLVSPIDSGLQLSQYCGTVKYTGLPAGMQELTPLCLGNSCDLTLVNPCQKYISP